MQWPYCLALRGWVWGDQLSWQRHWLCVWCSIEAAVAVKQQFEQVTSGEKLEAFSLINITESLTSKFIKGSQVILSLIKHNLTLTLRCAPENGLSWQSHQRLVLLHEGNILLTKIIQGEKRGGKRDKHRLRQKGQAVNKHCDILDAIHKVARYINGSLLHSQNGCQICSTGVDKVPRWTQVHISFLHLLLYYG